MALFLKHEADATRSTKKYYFIVYALLTVLFSTGSLAVESASSRPIDRSKNEIAVGEKIVTRILTEEDNFREIEIGVGEIIRVDLRFNAGTGYGWYPDLPDDGSVQMVDSRVVDLSEKGMVGGPAIGMWYFKALGPGNTTVTILHYRVWEGHTKATKKFIVKLRLIDKRGGR